MAKTYKINPEFAPAEPIEIVRAEVIDVAPNRRWVESIAKKAREPDVAVAAVKILVDFWRHH